MAYLGNEGIPNAPDRPNFYLIGKKSWLPIAVIGNVRNVISSPGQCIDLTLLYYFTLSNARQFYLSKGECLGSNQWVNPLSGNVSWRYFIILLCLMPDSFTRQRESACQWAQWVNPLSGNVSWHYFIILLCLMPDSFTRQRESAWAQWVNPLSGNVSWHYFIILLCLMPDSFTRQRESPWAQWVNPLSGNVSWHYFIILLKLFTVVPIEVFLKYWFNTLPRADQISFDQVPRNIHTLPSIIVNFLLNSLNAPITFVVCATNQS
jgi:hypothetical protein